MADIDRTGDKFSTWLRYEKESLDSFRSGTFNQPIRAGREQLSAGDASAAARGNAHDHSGAGRRAAASGNGSAHERARRTQEGENLLKEKNQEDHCRL